MRLTVRFRPRRFKKPWSACEASPLHPGALVRTGCLGNSKTVSEAARQLDLTRPEFESILAGESGISPDLAVKMETLGWATAEIWLKLQAAYDLAQAHRRAQCAALSREQFREAEACSRSSPPFTLWPTCEIVANRFTCVRAGRLMALEAP